ncbi:MAG: hypothetical protein ABSB15_09075 [Bryobacteraceae bacterium]
MSPAPAPAAPTGAQAEAPAAPAPLKSALSAPEFPATAAESIPAVPAYAERVENRIGAVSVNEPLSTDSLAAAPTPAAPAGDVGDGSLQQLAFAVKVQPGRSMLPLPRISAVNSGNTADSTARKTPGYAAASDSEGADSPQDSKVRATRQTPDDRANGASADASDADKKPGMEEDPKQNYETTAGSLPLHHGALVEEESRNAGVAAGASGSSSASKPPASGETVAPEPLLRPAAPMKDISVRVESTQGQNVDVRIVQRAGDLQIAVKSDDNLTTQGLRQGLSELTNRLNESGYQTETWRPGHSAAAPESAGESGNSSHQPPSGDAQSNSGSSQHNRGQRDNNPSNRPRWIQELQSNLDSGTASTGQTTGQFHGLTS